MRAILDFPEPGSTRAGPRLCFQAPRAVITADTPAQVLPRLQQVEAAVRSGAWAVGFVAYEAAPAFDAALETRPHVGPAPLLCFGIFDAPAPGAHGVERGAAPSPPAPPLQWRTSTARVAYDEAIASIREGIAAGDVYQVNHTLRFTASFSADAAAFHDALVTARHGLYHAFLEADDWAIISASPELFFERVPGPHGDVLTTRPMKGTIRRGRWLDEDRAMADRLAGSTKDRAENLMIVDLLRNDLGRVAQFGSVHVPSLFGIETYPTVHQMTSTVRGTLRPGTTLGDVLAAMFPCGSVTGAPKVTAMKAIARLEDSPRGPYCGAIGVVRPDGSATFNVAIRTAVVDRRNRTATYGAGGGITWDSVAEAEYDEVVAKASLLAHALPPFELLETMRMVDGVIPRLDLHLQRLAESAGFFRFPDHVAASARRALGQLSAALPAGRWRVRLTASRTGAVRITRTPLLPDHGPHHVALSAQPVRDDDPLLFHKTTARSAYDQRRAQHPGVFDVLLVNQRGELTEFSTGNLVLALDGELLTPARECGLLAGTLRQQALLEARVREAVIPAARIGEAEALWHLNSVRGWTGVRLDDGKKGRAR